MTNMKRFFQLICVLAFGLLALLVLGGQAAEAATIVVDANGNGDYENIQDAIDAASDDDTIKVWDGYYEERITVDKRLSIIGNDSATTIDGSGDDVVTIESPWVNLTGFIIKGNGINGAGVYSEEDNVSLDKLNVTGHMYGIFLNGSSNAKLENNTAYKNTLGIMLTAAPSNYIAHNTVDDNTALGIFLTEESHNCTIIYNNVTGNKGFGVAAQYSNNTQIIRNNITGNGDDSNTISGAVGFDLTEGGTLAWNIITHNTGFGVRMENTTKTTVKFNKIAENDDGFYTKGTILYTRVYLNDIFNNTHPQTGMANLNTGAELHARSNWWGDASGPDHTDNSDGEGDTATGLLDFDPWMGAAVKPEDYKVIEGKLEAHEVNYYSFELNSDGENISELFVGLWSRALEDRENLSATLYYGINDTNTHYLGTLPWGKQGSDPNSYFNLYNPDVQVNVAKDYKGRVQGLLVLENLRSDTTPFTIEHNLTNLKEKGQEKTLLFQPGETKFFNFPINATEIKANFTALAGWSEQKTIKDITLEMKYVAKEESDGIWIEETEFGWVEWQSMFHKYQVNLFNYTSNGTFVITNYNSFPVNITFKTLEKVKELNNSVKNTIASGMYQYYAFDLEGLTEDDLQPVAIASWLENMSQEENLTIGLFSLEGSWGEGEFTDWGYTQVGYFGWQSYGEFVSVLQKSVNYNNSYYLLIHNSGEESISYWLNGLYRLKEINNTEYITLKKGQTFFFTFDAWGRMDYPDFLHSAIIVQEGNETHLEAELRAPGKYGYDTAWGGQQWWGSFSSFLEANSYRTNQGLMVLRNTGDEDMKLCVNSLQKLTASNNRYNITLDPHEIWYYNLTIENISAMAAWSDYYETYGLMLEHKYIAEEFGSAYWTMSSFGWWWNEWMEDWEHYDYSFMNLSWMEKSQGYFVVRNNNDTKINFTINSVHPLTAQNHILKSNITKGSTKYYRMVVPYDPAYPELLGTGIWLPDELNQTNVTVKTMFVDYYYNEELGEWEYGPSYSGYDFGLVYDWFSEGDIFKPFVQESFSFSEFSGETSFFRNYRVVYFAVENYWNHTLNFTLNAPYTITELDDNSFSVVLEPGETRYYSFDTSNGESMATVVSLSRWLEYGNKMNLSIKLKHWDNDNLFYEEGYYMYTGEWTWYEDKTFNWAIANESEYLLVVTNYDLNESKVWFNSIFEMEEIDGSTTYELSLAPGESVFYRYSMNASLKNTSVVSFAKWVELNEYADYYNMTNVTVEIKYWDENSDEYISYSFYEFEYEFSYLFYEDTEFLVVVTNNDMNNSNNVTLRTLFELEKVGYTLNGTLEAGETRYYEMELDAGTNSTLFALTRWVEETSDPWNTTVEVKYWENGWKDYEAGFVGFSLHEFMGRKEKGSQSEPEGPSSFYTPFQKLFFNHTRFLIVVTNINMNDSSKFYLNSLHELEEVNNRVNKTSIENETIYYQFSVDPEGNATVVSLAGWLENGDYDNLTVEFKYWEDNWTSYDYDYLFGGWMETDGMPLQLLIVNETEFLVVVTYHAAGKTNFSLNSNFELEEVNNRVNNTIMEKETVYYQFSVDPEGNATVVSLAGWLENGDHDNLTVELKYWEDGWTSYDYDYLFASWMEADGEPLQLLIVNETEFLVVVTYNATGKTNFSLNSNFELELLDNSFSDSLEAGETRFYELLVEADNGTAVAFSGWLETGDYEDLMIEVKYWEDGWEDYDWDEFAYDGYYEPPQYSVKNDTNYLLAVTNLGNKSMDFALNGNFEVEEVRNLETGTLAAGETMFYNYTAMPGVNMSELFALGAWLEAEDYDNFTVEFKYWETDWDDYDWDELSFKSYYPFQMMVVNETEFMLVITNEGESEMNFSFNSLVELALLDNEVSGDLEATEWAYYNISVEADELNGTVVALAAWIEETNFTDLECYIVWYDEQEQDFVNDTLAYDSEKMEYYFVSQNFLNRTTEFYLLLLNNGTKDINYHLQGTHEIMLLDNSLDVSIPENQYRYFRGQVNGSELSPELFQFSAFVSEGNYSDLELYIFVEEFYGEGDVYSWSGDSESFFQNAFFGGVFNETLHVTVVAVNNGTEDINITLDGITAFKQSFHLIEYYMEDGYTANYTLFVNDTGLVLVDPGWYVEPDNFSYDIYFPNGTLLVQGHNETYFDLFNVTGEYMISFTTMGDIYYNLSANHYLERIYYPPTITNDSAANETDEDVYYMYDFNATDSDYGDELTWLLNTDATWLMINATSGVLSGTPDNWDVGVFYVNVTVQDLGKTFDFRNFTLEVFNINDKPVITSNLSLVPRFVNEDSEYNVTFTGTDDDLIHGDSITWTMETNATWLSSYEGSLTVYGTPDNMEVGSYWVNVTITDENKTYDFFNYTLTVNNTNDAPWLNATQIMAEPFVDEDMYYEYDFNGNVTDDDLIHGDVLNWSLASNATWLRINAATGLLNGTPDNWDVGWYWVNVTVEDTNKTWDFYNYTLQVNNTNDKPVLNQTQTPDEESYVDEDSKFVFDFNATDDDLIHGDVLSWILDTNAGNWLGIDVDTGVLSGTPQNEDAKASYTVNITVEDIDGAQDWFEFTLQVNNTNDAPWLNDTTIEAEPFTNEDDYYEYDFSDDVTDDDLIHGDVLNWSLASNATWLSLNAATGLLNGTPDNWLVGWYWVNVTVEDTNKTWDYYNYTLQVNNTNDKPVLNQTQTPDDESYVDEDSKFSFDFNATDDDFIHGDVLSWILDTDAGDWLGIDADTGVLSGTPQNEDVGEYYVNVTVEDKDKAFDSFNYTLTVNNTNDAPYITTFGPDSEVYEDSPYFYDFAAGDDDLIHGSEVLTWSIETDAAWLSIDDGSGELSGTPDNDDVYDSYYVNVTVEDKEGETDWFNFTVEVINTNDDPEIKSLNPDTEVDEDSEYIFTFTADDPDFIHGSEVLTWSVETDAAWLTITKDNEDEATLNGTPENDDVGDHEVTVIVEDEDGEEDEYTFTITVSNTNDAPEISITDPEKDDELEGEYEVKGEYGDMDIGDVLTVEIKIDDGEWIEITTADAKEPGRATEMEDWEYDWNTANFSNGEHTLYARVTDENDTIVGTDVTVTLNNKYKDAKIELDIIIVEELGKKTKNIVVNGSVDTKGDYLPETLEITLELDAGYTSPHTVNTNATGHFTTTIFVEDRPVGRHSISASATMPSTVVLTGEDNFLLVHPVTLGTAYIFNGATASVTNIADLASPRVDQELKAFDTIYAGDVIDTSGSTRSIVILFYSPFGTMLIKPDTEVGILKSDGIKFWISKGKVVSHVGEETEELSRASTGVPDIAFQDPLIDDLFPDADYQVVVALDEVTEDTLFSLDVDGDATTITTYRGAVNVRNGDNEILVDQYRTLTARAEGDLTPQDAAFDMVEIEGNVDPTFTVSGQDISTVAGAYHIPALDGGNQIVILPEGNDYEVDIDGLGAGEYEVIFSRVRSLEERQFSVRTRSTSDTQDSYSMDKNGVFTIESTKETDKTYDIEIVRTDANGIAGTPFTGTDYNMQEEPQSFEVHDWENLGSKTEKAVTYTVGTKIYDISSGQNGRDINELMKDDEEEDSYLWLIITFILLIGLVGGVFAMNKQKTGLLGPSLGEEKKEKFSDVAPEKKSPVKEDVSSEVRVSEEKPETVSETVSEIESEEPEVEFPVVGVCPECNAKMRLANPGKFPCYKCKEELVVEEDGNLCVFKGSEYFDMEAKGSSKEKKIF